MSGSLGLTTSCKSEGTRGMVLVLGALSVMIHSITTLPMLCVGSWVSQMQSAGPKQTELSSKA